MEYWEIKYYESKDELEKSEKAIGDMSKEIVELNNKLEQTQILLRQTTQRMTEALSMNNELNDRIFELQDQAFKYMRMTASFEKWLNLHR